MRSVRLTIVLVAAATIGQASHADDIAEAGRTVFEKNRDAVVTVKLVLKQGMVYSGRDSGKDEVKNEVSGTVIGEDGLTLVSLTAIDPGAMYTKMIGGNRGDSNVRFESELSDAKIVLPSGKEIAAKIVLRDRDLDLAFLRPTEKPADAMTHVNLDPPATARELDEVIVLNRLGRIAGRQPAVAAGRIAAVVDKPRTFYILEQAGVTYGLGTPVFAMDGNLLGLVFLRSMKTSGSNGWGSMFSGTSNTGVLPVIVPVVDILDSAKQVPGWEEEGAPP